MIGVTGATGRFGSRLVAALRDAGEDVRAFGARDVSDVDPAMRDVYTQWDIGAGPLEDAPELDAVVHAAAKVGVWGDAREFARANVEGTRNVLATWPEAHIVHISSSSVYPRLGSGALHEADAPIVDAAGVAKRQLHGAYSETKAIAEHEVASRAKHWTILRPHKVYDDADVDGTNALLARVAAGRVGIVGPGDRTRVSVTHVDNLVQAARQALDTGTEGVFNIADLEAPTVDALAQARLARAGATDIRPLHLPRRATLAAASGVEWLWRTTGRTGEPPVTRYTVEHEAFDHVLDLTAAQRDLGYAPTRSWRDLTPSETA